MKSFNELSLPEALQASLQAIKFETPTPIQAASIPIALTGKDLIGRAQTGTGKTAAFVIPMIAKILKEPKSLAVIMTPTRELAAQIQDVVIQLTQHSKDIRTALLIGGASMGPQIRALRQRPSIIIATPGRITDHLKRNHLDLSHANMVVLDEADRMLDMGFAPQIDKVFEFISKERQTLLFSATLPKNILKLAERYMKAPERVSVGDADKAAVKIKQTHVQVDGKDKNAKILEILKTRTGSILVFARTKLRTDRLARMLKGEGLKVSSIHGGRTQSQRLQALEGFRDGYYPILVATDVAARGLDIPQIELVINYDLPETGEDYIHRIGRTARAGASGEALSLVTPEELRFFKSLSQPRDGQALTNNQRGRQNRGGGGSRGGSRGGSGSGRPHRKFGDRQFSNKRGPSSRFGGSRSEGSAGFRTEGPRSEGTKSFAPRGHQPRGEGRPEGRQTFGRTLARTFFGKKKFGNSEGRSSHPRSAHRGNESR